MTLPSSGSSTKNKIISLFPQSFYSRSFLVLTLLESVINISIETVIIIRTDLIKSFSQLAESDNVSTKNPLTVYLSIFILSHLFQLYYASDALRQKNTIQLIGLCGFNFAIMIYALIQIPEIREIEHTAIGVESSSSSGNSSHRSPLATLVLLITIPAIIGISQVGFMILTFHLFKEFGWQIYKQIGADRKLKRMYMIYQIFICSIKFDYFFLIAFTLQLVLLVPSVSTVERTLTILALPVTLVFLGLGYYGVRFESRTMMGLFGLGLLSGTVYFSYKLLRIWHGRHDPMSYQNVFKSLTVFSVVCLLMTLTTFILAITCTRNFDNGLKAHMKQTSGVLKKIGAKKRTDQFERYPNRINLTETTSSNHTHINTNNGSSIKSFQEGGDYELGYSENNLHENNGVGAEGFEIQFNNNSSNGNNGRRRASKSIGSLGYEGDGDAGGMMMNGYKIFKEDEDGRVMIRNNEGDFENVEGRDREQGRFGRTNGSKKSSGNLTNQNWSQQRERQLGRNDHDRTNRNQNHDRFEVGRMTID